MDETAEDSSQLKKLFIDMRRAFRPLVTVINIVEKTEWMAVWTYLNVDVTTVGIELRQATMSIYTYVSTAVN